MIKTEWIDQGNNTGTLRITLAQTKWQDAQTKALDELSKNVEVKGFREGHVPASIAKKHVNQDELYHKAVEFLATEAMIQGLQEHSLSPIMQPTMSVVSYTDQEAVIDIMIVEMPNVTLGQYKGLKADKEEVVVSDEEIQTELNNFLEQQAQMVVQERAIENGDTVIFDYKGLKDDVAFDGGTQENAELVIGSGQFIPGFEEQMIGMTANEEKVIDITFPEDYHSEDLKGQAVKFELKIHEVKTKVVPELTDELVAQQEIPEITTVAELKNRIHESMKANKESNSENQYFEALLDQIIENSQIELADELIKNQQESILKRTVNQYAQQGITEDLFIQILGGGDREKLLETYKEQAQKEISAQLIFDAIAKAENINASEQDVENHFAELAKMYGMEVEAIKEQLTDLAQVEYHIISSKVIDFIKNNAE